MATEQTAVVRLGFRTLPGEKIRDTVKRYAEPYGLEREALAFFDSDVQAGASEADAALYALGEWDLLEILGNGDEYL